MTRQILITGWGSVGPDGIAGTLQRTEPIARSESFEPGKLRWRHVSHRACERFARLDAASRLALAAAEMLGIPLPAPDESFPGTGIVLESRAGSVGVDSEFLAELHRGIASPTLFTYTLPSAGMAEIAMRFRISGPTTCLMDENDSGSIALWEAMELLWSGEIDACICVACNAPMMPFAGAESAPRDAQPPAAGRASALFLETVESAERGERRAIASLELARGDQPATERSLDHFCEWLSREGRDSSTDLRVRSSSAFPPGQQLLARRAASE